ncbi:uncharacterized protein SCHCODRAFT_02696018 [Schizophyllum commune H4-8]|uniref:uncharacterized protein n=1 Tax=Schizophyllum commune (strain H4-8 / FGSC 9210) TaxID=578458 RepID=UPI00215F7E50|nr:uncharacterized protein SCHCODRAFT_02696018 [Schizophyllum commune H4-8]KAI5897290.1 hypothetical protein SCHCODRAFT_02696018 [Schizophyllum commune H4-8]
MVYSHPPISSVTPRPSIVQTWYQRQAYNGYKKYHTLKFQAVMLSNGMFGHLHGPEHAVCEGTDKNTCPPIRFPQLFGDLAYGLNYHIISPFAKANCTADELH